MKTGHGTFRRATLLCSGAGIALVTSLALSAPVMAQDTAAQKADDGVTEVVVTGIRRGIQDAISAKRNSTSIVEAVSAEDIGKLPDQSIAESIARLPGIAAQRTNGRAQSLSVRGLGPDFTVTTLNGREQVSTNDGRGVEFDQYPSELISQVLVYKTPNASMPTQGIAGTADLRTVRPLSFGKQVVALNYRREQNSNDAFIGGSSNTGNRYAVTYIDQFFNKTLGVAIGYASTSSPSQLQKWEAWGYTRNFYGTNNTIIDGAKPEVASSNLDRDGLMAVLEWKPNDRLHMTVDAYHSEFNETQLRSRIEFPLFNPANNSGSSACPTGCAGAAVPTGWDGQTRLVSYTASNGLVNSATFSGIKTVLGNYVTQREATLDNIGWNTRYRLSDNWLLEADLSHAKVDRTDLILETTAGTGLDGSGALDTVTIKQSGQQGATITSALDYTNYSTIFLTDPRGWGGGTQAGYLKNPTIVDELDIIRLAATRTFDNNPIFSKVSFGINRTERSKSKVGNEGTLTLSKAATPVPMSMAVPEQYRRGTTALDFIGIKGMISYDALGMYNGGVYTFRRNVAANAIKNTWAVDETVTTLYFMADINTELLGKPLLGNIGVQQQHAEQTATSIYTGGTVSPDNGQVITGGTDYNDVLPSLNLSWEIFENTQLRFAAAKTLSRPKMEDMSAGFSYDTCRNPCATVTGTGGTTNYYWTANGGNPALEPWRATSYDLSIEKYFGRKGYVALALFKKDLTSYVFDARTTYDFSDTTKFAVNPNQLGAGLPAHPAQTNRVGIYSTKLNGDGGYIRGLEFSASIPGELITPWLDGFGVIYSFTKNESEIKPNGTTAIPIPGLSEKVENTTVYYEKYGFSARVSQRKRDDFLGEVPDYQNNAELVMVKGESILDAQLSYTFQSGPLKDLSILLQGNNLTNEPFMTYYSTPAEVRKYEDYGSSYIIGINYKF